MSKTTTTQVDETQPTAEKPAPIEKPWLTGELKPEHMENIYSLIHNYEFPDEAIQKTTHPTMKKEIFGYNAQYIINALNEILGMNHWREYGEMKEEKPANSYVSIYSGTFEVGNWKTRKITETTADGIIREYEEKYFDYLIKHTTYGGSRNMDHWESLKGAKTNFLKKICSYYSIGWKSYALQLDEDFMNMASDKTESTTKTYNNNNNKTPGKTPATPPPAKAPVQPQKPEEIKLASEKQVAFIEKLYEEYKEKSQEPKTLEFLAGQYNKKTIKDLSSKQATEFIDQLKKHVASL